MTRQYIVQFDSAELPRIDTDFLVIGTGNAGLNAAMEASQHGDVLLITKEAIKEGNHPAAKGGITTIMSDDITPASHIEDTLKAGLGLCNQTAVEVMVEKGIQQVSELIQARTHCDKGGGDDISRSLQRPEECAGNRTSLCNRLDDARG